MNYQDFQQLCERRRSVRYFDDAPVKQQDILALLELARLAPSVGNTQPWKFHVVLNKDLRRKLMECSCYGNFVEGADAFIIVTSDAGAKPVTGETLWNPKELEYSCMAAMSNILLGATSMDLASCWVSLHHGPAHELLGLPLSDVVVGGVMIGHFRKGEEQASGAHERKALKDMYKFYE
jgi:nitroreductase